MSLPAVEPVVGVKFANGAGDTWSAGPCSSEAVSAREVAAAAAQSAACGSFASGAEQCCQWPWVSPIQPLFEPVNS